MERCLDDRCIIPDEIKNMSHEERMKEIEKLEREAALNKRARRAKPVINVPLFRAARV